LHNGHTAEENICKQFDKQTAWAGKWAAAGRSRLMNSNLRYKEDLFRLKDKKSNRKLRKKIALRKNKNYYVHCLCFKSEVYVTIFEHPL